MRLTGIERSRSAIEKLGIAEGHLLEDTAPVDANELISALLFEKYDPRNARIVELRFFGGLTVEETATVLGIAPVTVMREWEKARAWLYKAVTAAWNARPAPAEGS